MIFYLYAIWGIETFNTNTKKFKEGSPYTASNDYTDFNSFGGAMLILF